MKKLLTILTPIMLAVASMNVQAEVTPVEGEHYAVIKPAAAQKQVIEFFSFYCPHCYDYETKYHFPDKVKTDLPKDVEFVQYHVNYMGGISTDLTKAWSLAMIKGFAGEVKMGLFDGVRDGSIKSVKDINSNTFSFILPKTLVIFLAEDRFEILSIKKSTILFISCIFLILYFCRISLIINVSKTSSM